MSPTLPLIIHVIAAGIGAIFFAWRFQRLRFSPFAGAGIGAAAGAIGSLIFMLPLNYCTFEPERAVIDFAFGVLLIGIGMAITLLPLNWLISSVVFRRRNPGMTGATQGGLFRGSLLPFAFLAPTLIVLALFLYYPSLDTFRLSTLLARLGIPRTAFVCVDNFTRLASDANYLKFLGTTILLSTAIVVIGLSLALAIALLAYQPIKGASIYRTLLIWPYAISPVVAGVIFLLLFNPTGGIVNYGLNNLFGISIGWLNDPNAGPWAVIIASVWKSLGYNILFYIAGLQNVPKDIQEAASIDGANAVRRFFTVVVPLLSPITFFLVITNMTYAFFETFGTIDYLTGGGPLRSTTTLMYNIYDIGIRNNDLGKGAAQSIVLFVLVIGLTVLQFRTQRVEYGA
ncbi:MAG: sugar ABC transporter permease [Anaerolineae bacterium]